MKTKRIISLLIILTFIISMSIPSFAAKPVKPEITGTITVEKIVTGNGPESYEVELYQVVKKGKLKFVETGSVSESTNLIFENLPEGTYTIIDTTDSDAVIEPATIKIWKRNTAGVFTSTSTYSEPPPPPTSYDYLALGDSIATGTVGIGSPTYSYVYQFNDYLSSEQENTTFTNLAHDGDTSGDLLYKLNNDTAFIDAVEEAEIITISIGGNNLLDAGNSPYFTSIDTTVAEENTSNFEEEYPLIIAKINSLNSEVEIMVMTLYNPYNVSDGSGSLYDDDAYLHTTTDIYLSRINDAIEVSGAYEYVDVVDVYGAFDAYAESNNMDDITLFYDGWFWRDPHPNQAGQNIIYELHQGVYDYIH
jgi:lysophospholipase L1-like esterase